MSTSPTWMRDRRVVGLTVGFVISAFVATLLPAVSAGADTPRLGHGRTYGGYFHGYRTTVVAGHKYKIWCSVITGSVQYISKITATGTITSIALVDGRHVTVGTAKTAELRTILADKKVVTNLANAKTVDNESAAVYDALNHIVWDGVKSHDSTVFHRSASAAPQGIKTETSRLVNEARTHHGKSTLTLKVTHAPTYAGDLGTAVAHVTNNPAGRVVSFANSNGLITATAKTDSHGDATVHFLPTHGGSGVLSATAAGLTPSKLGVSNYKPGQQMMITQLPRLTLHAKATFTTSLHKLKVNCPATCDGTRVPVTGTVVHNYTAAYEHLSAVVQRTTNGTTKTVSLGSVAVKPGATLAHDWHANDGDKNLVVTLSGTWGGHAFSIVVAKLAVVDCPRFTKLVVVQDVFCNCSKVVIGGVGDGKTIGAPIVNQAGTTLTFTFSDNAGHSFTKPIPAGQSIPALEYTVGKSQYTYSVTETLPYATHSGTRKLTINGSTTVSVS